MFSLPPNAITDLSSSLRFISVFIVIGMDISSSLVVPSLTLALMFISIAILDSAEVFSAAVLNASASAKNAPREAALVLSTAPSATSLSSRMLSLPFTSVSSAVRLIATTLSRRKFLVLQLISSTRPTCSPKSSALA